MSDELYAESTEILLSNLSVQSQQTFDVPASSSKSENKSVSSKNFAQNIKLYYEGHRSTLDPRKVPFKLENKDYTSKMEAKSKLDVIENKLSTEEKECVDSSMAKKIDTKIIKFQEQSTPLHKYPFMIDVFCTTKVALDRLVGTIQKQARVLEEHVAIIYKVTLNKAIMSPEIINYLERMERLKSKNEHGMEGATEMQTLFPLLAVNVYQEAKEVYSKHADILNDFVKMANLRELYSLKLAKLCFLDAQDLNEFSRKLSDKAAIHKAHAKIFNQLKSIFQKYEGLCIFLEESFNRIIS